MSTIKTVATLAVQGIATITANYATSTLIDMYVSPDLKDCKSEEEKEAKIKSFNTATKVAKISINVLEAAAIGKISHAVLTKDSKTNSKNNEESSNSSANSETSERADSNEFANRGYLVGKNYLVRSI